MSGEDLLIGIHKVISKWDDVICSRLSENLKSVGSGFTINNIPDSPNIWTYSITIFSGKLYLTNIGTGSDYCIMSSDSNAGDFKVFTHLEDLTVWYSSNGLGNYGRISGDKEIVRFGVESIFQNLEFYEKLGS